MAGYWKRLAAAVSGREQRASYGPSFNYAGGVGIAGYGDDYSKRDHMSADRAESLSTVLACVNIIAETAGMMPPEIYETRGNTRIRVTDSPFQRLLTNPFATAGWPDFVSMMIGGMLLHGNGVAQVVSDGRGVVTSLRPLPFERIVPLWRLKDPQDYRLLFNVMIPGVEMYQLLDTEVMLLRDRMDSGLLARSRISRAAGALVTAESLQNYSNAAFRNGVSPSGTIELPGKLTPEGMNRIKTQFKQRYAGTDNAKEPLFLDSGMNFKPMSVSPVDAQILESRVFSVQEICRVFGVPPVMVAEWSRSTFTNSTEAGRWFIQYSVLPIVKRFEHAFKQSVMGLDSPYDLTLDASGILRGDAGARWTAHQIALTTGAMTIDEVRAQENLPPLAQAGTPEIEPDET